MIFYFQTEGQTYLDVSNNGISCNNKINVKYAGLNLCPNSEHTLTAGTNR